VERVNDPARLARLNAVKLQALVRDHVGGEQTFELGELSAGAALLNGPDAWVLLADRPERGLGGAIGWAVRRGAERLHVVADTATGTLARRARGFSLPIEVWHADGRSLLPAVREPLPISEQAQDRHRELVPVMVVAGAVPHEEFGVVSGEVWGLEVCRVVDDPHTGAVRLEVGIGAHDREAFQLLHGDRPTADALAEVVRAVGVHRRPGATGHPLNRLAAERALRAKVIAEPSLLGAAAARAVPPPVPRLNLKDPVPCVAVATIEGDDATVVFSSGVDLDVVPFAVDARAATGVERCMVVMPSRDAIDIQLRIAALAVPPIEIVSL